MEFPRPYILFLSFNCRLCGVRRPSSACSRVGVGSSPSRRLEPSGPLPSRLLPSLSDRFCKEQLRTSRFAKRGNSIQLRLGVRLCLFRVRRMGDILRMAFTQNRFRSFTGASFSLTVCLLSYGPPPSICLTQPFTHHSILCDP